MLSQIDVMVPVGVYGRPHTNDLSVLCPAACIHFKSLLADPELGPPPQKKFWSDFQIRYIRFWVQQEEIMAEVPEQKTDALTVLMASATELKLPEYLAGNTKKDKLFNNLCDCLVKKTWDFQYQCKVLDYIALLRAI